MKEFFIVSYSYTGHTHQIAQAIHTLTGGDWCEILGTDLPGILRDWLNQNGLQSLSDAYTGDQYKETVEKGKINHVYERSGTIQPAAGWSKEGAE